MKNTAEERKQTMTISEENHSLALEDEMRQVLGDFRASVHGWSDAAYHRPRKVSAAEHRAWRRVLAWGLGCVLAGGAFYVGIYPLRQGPSSVATARPAEPVRTVTEKAAPALAPVAAPVQEAQMHGEDESWMTRVDSDVSRQVPAAMEPMAQLLAEDEQE